MKGKEKASSEHVPVPAQWSPPAVSKPRSGTEESDTHPLPTALTTPPPTIPDSLWRGQFDPSKQNTNPQEVAKPHRFCSLSSQVIFAPQPCPDTNLPKTGSSSCCPPPAVHHLEPPSQRRFKPEEAHVGPSNLFAGMLSPPQLPQPSEIPNIRSRFAERGTKRNWASAHPMRATARFQINSEEVEVDRTERFAGSQRESNDPEPGPSVPILRGKLKNRSPRFDSM